MPSLWRKKPVVIQAMQYDGERETTNLILGWIGTGSGIARSIRNNDERYLLIKTMEGEMRADVGDWVVRGVKGEYYPVKPDIFDATYDPVE